MQIPVIKLANCEAVGVFKAVPLCFTRLDRKVKSLLAWLPVQLPS